VQTELADPNSLLNWHKTLIEMRRKRDALRDGGMVMIDGTNATEGTYEFFDSNAVLCSAWKIKLRL